MSSSSSSSEMGRSASAASGSISIVELCLVEIKLFTFAILVEISHFLFIKSPHAAKLGGLGFSPSLQLVTLNSA